MSFAGRLKCYVSSFILFYSLYLLTFKCNKLNETPLEHGIETVFHPLSHHHNTLCDGLNKGVNFVNPYIDSVRHQLDEHVYSHHLYKQYKVDSKLEVVKGNYHQYVHPLVIKFLELVEVAEYHIAEHFTQQWGRVQALYNDKVAPKLA